MAERIFLKLEGVEGDSADATHKGEIEILSFEWDVSTPATGFPPPPTAVAVQPSVEDFRLRLVASSTLPALLSRCITGEHIKEGTLTVRRAGTSSDYLEYRFADILIARVQQEGLGQNVEWTSARAGGAAEIGEFASTALVTVSLNFARITVVHFTEPGKARKTQPATFSWDFAKRTSIAEDGGQRPAMV